MTSDALLGCHWAGDVSAQNTPYMRGVMAVGTSKTLKFFLASLCVLSFIAVANIVGFTAFLHSPARFRAVLRFSASLSPPEQQRGPQSHGWSSVDAGSTSTTLRSGASLPSRTYPVSSTPSRRSDITRLSSKSFASTTVVSPTTVRPLECDRCFVHNYPSVIRNPGICASDRGDVIDLLLLITTVHSHLRARQAQRGTWLSVARGNRGNVRYVYLLGETFNDTVREALLKENATYGDLLMEGFKDTYRNLTLKTMMGMNWAVTLCPKARYVMKTDDDMWVNVRSVLNLTRTHAKDLQTRVAGACRGRGFPLRKPDSKWTTSVGEYPQSSFPSYCSGTGYVTSMAVVSKVAAVSPSVPFFYLEDIYVGLCLRKLRLAILQLKGFFHRKTNQDPCFLQSSNVVTSHQVEPDVLVKAWNAKCVNSTI